MRRQGAYRSAFPLSALLLSVAALFGLQGITASRAVAQPRVVGAPTATAARAPAASVSRSAPVMAPAEPVAPGPQVAATPKIPGVSDDRFYFIDLPTALQLADARNPQVALAREQVREAQALEQASQALWLPSIRGGGNYNKHEGSIQRVEGPVINISRGAFFAGSGSGIYGAGPPMIPGVVSTFHFSDALFRPLAARQFSRAQNAAARAATNDTLLDVSLAYTDLLRSGQDEAISRDMLADSEQLTRLTAAYARTGEGLRSDADRALTDLQLRKIELERAREGLQVSSARLAQLLRLDPALVLLPADAVAMPVKMVDDELPIRVLVAEGLANRPELIQSRALVGQAVARLKREQYAPLVPSVLLATSYGTLGGGVGSQLTSTNNAFNFDALAWWELRNLGVGDRTAQNAARSQMRQAQFDRLAVMDRVAREIVEAHAQVECRRRQIAIAKDGVKAAIASHQLNLERIKAAKGLPIEALQSIQALAQARRDYLRAVVEHNAAQFTLQRALGWPTQLRRR